MTSTVEKVAEFINKSHCRWEWDSSFYQYQLRKGQFDERELSVRIRSDGVELAIGLSEPEVISLSDWEEVKRLTANRFKGHKPTVFADEIDRALA